MAEGATAQTATTASTNSSFETETPRKRLTGQYLMADAKEALYFLQGQVAQFLRSVNCSFCASNGINSCSNQNLWNAMKTDVTRLVTFPVFWVLVVLACTSFAAASVAALLWVLCAPLFLRNSDLLTWGLMEKPEKFRGKVVWVTGGSTGIGLALCRQLAVREIRGLIITGRSLSRLENARGEILAHALSQGVSLTEEDILLLPLDLSKGLRPEMGGEEAAAADAWEQTVQQAIKWRGGVDILFNNAGRLAVGCLPPTETFAEVMDANFLSVIKMTNLILPHMRARNQGHIVFTNSSSAHFNFGGFNAYATSKVALLSFANLLRQDLRGCGSKNVLVTSVHPGYVPTNIQRNVCDSLVDSNCSRSSSVKWAQKGLDVDFASLLILRAVSRDLEEAWLATPVELLQMYAGFYLPQLVYFIRHFTAKRECERMSAYREAIVSQLIGGNKGDSKQ